MVRQSYRLRSGLAGFISRQEELMEITIPAGSVLVVLQEPLDGTGFARVRVGDRKLTVPMRELQKCGVLLGGAHVAT